MRREPIYIIHIRETGDVFPSTTFIRNLVQWSAVLYNGKATIGPAELKEGKIHLVNSSAVYLIRVL